ncbi:hypothetical protein CBS147320_7632 [Aspergillus niger]|nr:hypothetical protein CBS147320_7632 [Aspergillus niger]
MSSIPPPTPPPAPGPPPTQAHTPPEPQPPTVPTTGPKGSLLLELHIFNGHPFKDHWAYWISSANDPLVGAKIHATGDVRNGFVFEIKRSHDLRTSPDIPIKRIPLQWVDGRYLDQGKMFNGGVEKIENMPVCAFEEVLSKVKVPGKTLNSVILPRLSRQVAYTMAKIFPVDSPLCNLFGTVPKKPTQNVFASPESPPNTITDYPQPCVSPYASPVNHITIGRTTYAIPEYYVLKIPNLKFAYMKEFALEEMYADIGHTFIHYLYTGEYETLAGSPSLPPSKSRAREFKRSVYAFHMAQRHQIQGLLEHAKRYMYTFVDSVSALDLLKIAREVYATMFTGRKWFEDFVHDQLAAAFKAGEEQFRNDILKYGVGSDAKFDQFILELVMKIYSESIAKLTKAAANGSASGLDTPASGEDASTDQTNVVAEENEVKSDPEASLDGSDDGVKDPKPADAVPEQPDEKPKSLSPAPASPLSFTFRSPQPVRHQSFTPEPGSPKTQPKAEPELKSRKPSKPAASPKPIPETTAHPEKATQSEKAPFDKPEPNPKFTPRSGAQTPENAPSDNNSSPRKKSKKKRGGKNKNGNSNAPPISVNGTPKKWEPKTTPESISFI